jgi:hypothetical protein
MLISLASLSDIDDIMSFINSNFKENHILSRNKSFFEYEHRHKNNINFIIAKDENKIVAILGFIQTSFKDTYDVFTVMWKVMEKNKTPLLGIRLLKFLEDLKGVKNVLSTGINTKTIGIYKYLNMYTDKLNQYAIINRQLKNYKIASISKKPKNNLYFPTNISENNIVKKILNKNKIIDFDFDNYKTNIPYKSEKYFKKRYLDHPIYNYDIYGVYSSEKIIALFVVRPQSFKNSKVLRIVDFIGNENSIYSFADYISKLIIKTKYEYADLYCFGFNHEALVKSGFELVDDQNEEIIIPNYFQPFERKNIPMWFFINSKYSNKIKLFKADGDQDRPS